MYQLKKKIYKRRSAAEESATNSPTTLIFNNILSDS